MAGTDTPFISKTSKIRKLTEKIKLKLNKHFSDIDQQVFDISCICQVIMSGDIRDLTLTPAKLSVSLQKTNRVVSLDLLVKLSPESQIEMNVPRNQFVAKADQDFKLCCKLNTEDNVDFTGDIESFNIVTKFCSFDTSKVKDCDELFLPCDYEFRGRSIDSSSYFAVENENEVIAFSHNIQQFGHQYIKTGLYELTISYNDNRTFDLGNKTSSKV